MSTLSPSQYTKSGRTKYAFAEFPSAKVYKKSTGKSWANHLIFGDYVKIINDNIKDGRVYVRSRNTNGWMNEDELRKDRILEVNFVDIGQGDGCHIVTPDDRHFIIDAGKTDNMDRYLTWRFNLYRRSTPLRFPISIIISHSDSDHYYGFYNVFKNKKIKIDKIFHNGLVERPGQNRLGKSENGFLFDLIDTKSQMLNIINKESNRKGSGSLYCKTLYQSLKYNPEVDFIGLAEKDEFLEDLNASNSINNKEFSAQILGPIRSKKGGKECLKTINDLGKDKNGHSVILRFKYKDATIMLGGDVNEEFGKIIHEYYKSRNELNLLQVDIAKACHHGSNHFHYEFIEAINAAGTVISSGDDESYSHPRPDAIGALGKCGYGKRPLVFSTELARSNKEITIENIEKVAKKYEKIKALKAERKLAATAQEKTEIDKKIRKLNKEINSFQTKYGMISLRTDGEKMILAQKYERKAAHGKWDIHELTYSNRTKRFERV